MHLSPGKFYIGLEEHKALKPTTEGQKKTSACRAFETTTGKQNFFQDANTSTVKAGNDYKGDYLTVKF